MWGEGVCVCVGGCVGGFLDVCGVCLWVCVWGGCGGVGVGRGCVCMCVGVGVCVCMYVGVGDRGVCVCVYVVVVVITIIYVIVSLFTTGVAPQNTPPPEEFNLEDCQKELRDFYLLEKSKVPLLQWEPGDAKDMSNIFVDPLLIQKEDKNASKFLRNIDLVNLKTSEGQRANRVLVAGQGGTGKTTVADNIAYKWANGSSAVLSEFSLVFVIAMSKIQNSNAGLIDIIFQQVLPEDSRVSREGLRSYIDSHAKEILFIFDAMDEDSSGTLKNTSSEITKILHNRRLRESCIVLTTRPEWVNNLGDQLRNYSQVEIIGFSPENIDLYIQKYFKGDKSRGTMLITEIKNNDTFRSLASTPVLLLMMCLLWEDRQSLPTTKTQLLNNTFKYMWKIYRKKQGDNSPSDEESDTDSSEGDLTDLVLKLGKVVLHGLGNAVQVVFKSGEFEGEVLKLGCKVNLVNKETVRSGLKRITQVQFVNMYFQYYCAGVYLSKLLDTNQAEFDENLRKMFTRIDNRLYCFDDILDFCCGTNPKATAPCLRHMMCVVSVSLTGNFDTSLHLGHIFESQLDHKQCEKFLPIYSSVKTGLHITRNMLPSVCHLTHLHRASKRTVLSTLERIIIETDFISWLPSLLRCTTNLKTLTISKEGFNSLPMKSDDESNLTACFQAISDRPCLETLLLESAAEVLAHDVTNLLHLLYENKANLSVLVLFGFKFNFHTMAQFLSICTSLSYLGLWGVHDQREERRPAADEIMRMMPKLTKLSGIGFTQIAIGNGVKYLKPIANQLKEVALDCCQLSENNLMDLIHSLNGANQLTKIELCNNWLSLSACSTESFARWLEGLPQLQTVNLRRTGLNDECTCILAKHLKNKPTLAVLHIGGNPVSAIGKNALIRYDREEQLIPVDWCFNLQCGRRENRVPGIKLKRCTRCLIAKYCNANCQKAHWKLHRKDCKDRRASKKKNEYNTLPQEQM